MLHLSETLAHIALSILFERHTSGHETCSYKRFNKGGTCFVRGHLTRMSSEVDRRRAKNCQEK